jgi:nucleotide sugar dehydrogenase
MNICIVGLGYVGLTLAGRCLQVGHTVYGLEINEMICESIRRGRAHFHEPGLDDIISSGIKSKKFQLSEGGYDSFDLDVIVITVGTPLKPGSTEPNLGYIVDSIRSVAHKISQSNLLVLRSTVTVGLTRNSVIPIIENITGLKDDEFNVAFCPERTLEGDALNELASLPQVISGNNRMAEKLAESFFNTIASRTLLAETLEAAELVKLFNNVYRDINFSIGNLFNDVAMHFGIDGLKAIELANKDYSRSHIAKPGLVGGPCLEKDSYILCSNIDDIGISSVVLEARKYNEALESKIVSWAMENSSSRIIICGMAFKGVPSTNDLRGSNSVNIARKLHAYGRSIYMFDPVCNSSELKSLRFGSVVTDLNELEVVKSDCILVLNNNKYFETELFASFISAGKILDCWDVVSCQNKYTLGNYHI